MYVIQLLNKVLRDLPFYVPCQFGEAVPFFTCSLVAIGSYNPRCEYPPFTLRVQANGSAASPIDAFLGIMAIPHIEFPDPTSHRPPQGMRIRTSIMLLFVLLIAMFAISGFMIKLMQGQHQVLDEAIRESRAQAMALLANRIEQGVLSAMRPPFLALKNIPLNAVDKGMMARVLASFPEIQYILVLDSKMRLRDTFPEIHNQKQQLFNKWLIERSLLEHATNSSTRLISIDKIDGKAVLFARQPINDIDKSAGWLLIRFDLDKIKAQQLAPLLDEFSHDQDGHVQLQDENAAWDDLALNWPVGPALPGWMLALKPDMEKEKSRVQHKNASILGVTGGILLAMLMATFAVWREIRREHALVDLRDRFVANVSHELKTPLALIRMYAETLYLKRVPDSTRQHDYHRIILREAERLSQMINTVLDFSRLRQGMEIYHFTDYNLHQTLLRILDDYKLRLEQYDIQLDVLIPAAVPAVAHDPHGVTQIMLNLMDNAIKHGGGSGQICIKLAVEGNQVVLSVTDFGPGIPAADRARVRKPFQQGSGTDPTTGTGLGLALVDQISEAHHAQFILAAGPDGQGLTASVYFPIADITS